MDIAKELIEIKEELALARAKYNHLRTVLEDAGFVECKHIGVDFNCKCVGMGWYLK